MVKTEINRAYYDSIYGVTKAILSPVTDALSDSLADSIKRAVREGISESVSEINVWNLLSGKK